MTTETYYIWAKNKGYVGNNILFWGVDHRGYTCDLSKAGMYSKDEALKIVGHDYEDKIALLVNDVREIATMQVDSQHMGSIAKPLQRGK